MRFASAFLVLAFTVAACTQMPPTSQPSTRPAGNPASQPVATQPASRPAAISASPLGPWKPLTLPATVAANSPLKAVFFLNAKTGWVCGDHGLILSTTDGGGSWQKDDAASDATLRGIFFLDQDHGFACGDGDPQAPKAQMGHIVFGIGPMVCSTFLSTEDGGRTWQKKYLSTNFLLTSVATPDGKKIMIGNYGGDKHMDGDTVMITDGKPKARRAFRALFGVAALDEKHFVAVGSPVYVGFTPEPTDDLYTHKHLRAIYSDDAGATWKISTGSDGGVPLYAVAYRQDAGLLAVGDKGNILASEDLGATWVKRDSPTDKPLRAVAWASAKTAVAVGRGGAVIVSTDGGKTWTAAPIGSAQTFTGLAAAGDAFVAVTNEGKILRANAQDLAQAAATPAAK